MVDWLIDVGLWAIIVWGHRRHDVCSLEVDVDPDSVADDLVDHVVTLVEERAEVLVKQRKEQEKKS